MNFLPEDIAAYADEHTGTEPSILKELFRETHAKFLYPQMLSGHLQGRVLSMLSTMIKPKHILEIGTYTGYSAICLSEGLAEGGMIHTIDINEELSEITKRYFEKAGITEKVKQYFGNAMDIIPSIDISFDIVFIDADKEQYGSYYDLVMKNMKPGSYIMADNALWDGKVVKEEKDKETESIDAFNKKVNQDNRVENVLLPIRDGIMMIRII